MPARPSLPTCNARRLAAVLALGWVAQLLATDFTVLRATAGVLLLGLGPCRALAELVISRPEVAISKASGWKVLVLVGTF